MFGLQEHYKYFHVQKLVTDSRRAVEEMLRALEDHVGQREEMVQPSCFTGPEETGMVLTKKGHK